MTPATRRLHEQLLRLAKGMLKAWEEWVQATTTEQSTEQVPSSPDRLAG